MAFKEFPLGPTGGMTPIVSGTFSGAAVTISAIPQAYKNLRLVVRNFRPSTDGEALRLRVNADSTANRHYYAAIAGANNVSFNGTDWLVTGGQDSVAGDSSAVLDMFDYVNTTTWKLSTAFFLMNNATTTTNQNIGSGINSYNQTTAISSIYLFCNTGNPAAGTYILYGVS